MYTKTLMTSSAAYLLTLGLILSFDPDGILARAGVHPVPLLTLILQAAGALYLGFAILNWMAKDNLIGGVYSRPVALGNFLHFAVTAMALARSFAHGERAGAMVILATLYTFFAVWFGMVLFGSPVKRRQALSSDLPPPASAA